MGFDILSIGPYISGMTSIQRVLENVRAQLDMKDHGTRGCGRTFAVYMQMIGAVECGPFNTTFAYFGINEQQCKQAMHEFDDAMKFKRIDTDINVPSKRVFIPSTSQYFFFIPIHNWWQTRRGIRMKIAYLDCAYGTQHTQYDMDMIELNSERMYYG